MTGERQQERTCERVMGEGSTHWYCGARIVETTDYGNPILVCTNGHPQSGHPAEAEVTHE